MKQQSKICYTEIKTPPKLVSIFEFMLTNWYLSWGLCTRVYEGELS